MGNKFIDVLRGMYVSIPVPVRKKVAPLLALIPAEAKYGGTYKKFRSLISASENNPALIREYQNKKLKELVALSVAHSPYYRDLVKKAGIELHNEAVINVDMLSNFEILKKDILRDNVEQLLTVPRGALSEISTSGSSGKPLCFYLDKDRSVKEWAFIHHIWSKAGYRASDKRAVLRGVHIDNVDNRPWEYEPALRELRLSPFHLTDQNIKDFLEQISKRHIKYLHGYPSALNLISKYILRDGWDYADQIKGIFPISESLFLYQRKSLREAFQNSKILPFYGLSEKVAIAGEVDGRVDVYDFEPLYGITELVDENGEAVKTPGKRGRIVSTGLLNMGMPLIRYDTEDEAELVQAPEFSNSFRLRVKNIRSRWGQEFVVGKNGELVSIAAINIHSNAYAWIREFQFFQKIRGIVDVCIVAKDGVDRLMLEDFVKEIQEKVGGSIKFILKQVDKIERNNRGKSKFILQKLNLDDFR